MLSPETILSVSGTFIKVPHIPVDPPGPAQGFFLFKVGCFLTTVALSGARIWVSVKGLETILLYK